MPVTLRTRLCFVLALCASGCTSSPQPDAQTEDATPADIARDHVATDITDVSPPDDGAPVDAANDAPSDALDGTAVDAIDETPGADALDASMDTLDVFTFDGDPDLFLPGPCDMMGGGTVCTSDSDCVMGSERCLPTGCGSTQRCQSAGRPCLDDTDCLAGAQSCTRGVCVATGADCGDTRACPLGFTCEGTPGSRHCVDRRHHCDGIGFNSCPWSATCYSAPGIDNFCVPIVTRCTHDGACLLGSRCRDIDSDGLTECVFDGCSAGDCTPGSAAPLCSEFPLEAISHCAAHGICSASAPCLSGWNCVDAWGTGVTECHPAADVCQTESDCTGFRQLCYSSDPGADADLVGHCDGP